jgi:hypothetical protein
MSVTSLRNRLDRAIGKLPPKPVTRESIEANLRSAGLDVEATWRFICAEGIGSGQIRQLAKQGKLFAAIDRYKGMTGSYHEKAHS